MVRGMYGKSRKVLVLDLDNTIWGGVIGDDSVDKIQTLEMSAEIDTFKPFYLDRIAQLTNKTNQFNLTTRRYTLAEIIGEIKRPLWR
jgi:predicted enzyme involved in methoxymalonyl-ACP biosynthesis